MDWMRGYFAEGGYTFGFYPETMPLRLGWAALVQGHAPRRQKFRYLDAGCGQGLSVLLAAASHPDSEFVGIDFLPEHVLHGRRLAEAAGLTNIRFVEGDFVSLAQSPADLGMFDYVVCHGISTWISPVVRQGLFSLVGQVLNPGGVFYNSYNTLPGWQGTVPFQHLVMLEQSRKPGAEAIAAARASMEQLKANAPSAYGQLSGFDARLAAMAQQDPAYLVQEYNNQGWQPVFVSDMMEALAAHKLDYLGTATLPEAFEANFPAAIRKWLSQERDPLMKEQLRDYAVNQGFRRDLYVKGKSPGWNTAQDMQDCQFVANSLSKRPASGENFKIAVGSLKLEGNAQTYSKLLDMMSGPQGASWAQLKAATEPALHSKLPQLLSLLLTGGWVVTRQAAQDVAPAQRLNQAMARAAAHGAPYKYISLPLTGGAIVVSDTDWLLLGLHLEEVPREQWPDRFVEQLRQLNRSLSTGGKPITDKDQRNKAVAELMAEFVDRKLPFLEQQGAV